MMSLFISRKPDFIFTDDRGSLIQLVHEGFSQINVLESKANAFRGSHFHKRTIEAFFVVSGSVEVEFRNHDSIETAVFKAGDFFEIHPHVIHTMFFPNDCLMIQMYDTPVKNADGTKDIYTEAEFNV